MDEMFITPITPSTPTAPNTPIQSLNQLSGIGSSAEINGSDGVSLFKGIFEEAVNNVKTTEETLVEEQYLLATGQTEDAHTVMIASSQAQLAVDMLVSLRNRALESYNEIMRISL